MKAAILLVLLSLLLVLCNCTSSPQNPPMVVGPDGTISWEDAKTVIREQDVEGVFQTHSRLVGISLADGTEYHTTEPAIDDVIKWVRECGKEDSIAIMTE